MEHRPLSVAARLIALLLLSASAFAAESEPTPEQQADWQLRLDKAAAIQADAKERQDAADKVLEQKTAACFKKFLVDACREDARKEHVVASHEASRLQNEGKDMERAVKKEQREDKDRRHAEAAPERAEELAARQAETAASRQAAADKEAKTRADKAQQAEAGAKRKAAEEEQQRKKREEHDARIAAKKAEAERRNNGGAASQ